MRRPARGDELSVTNQSATGRGILVVCRCGNGFYVPKRRAGSRVACTLCGAPLTVPDPRSVHEAAAALAKGPKTLWEELMQPEEEDAAAGESAAQPHLNSRRRRWTLLGTSAALAVAFVAVSAFAIYRLTGSPSDSSGSEFSSEAGGFSVRLPSGRTARRFVESRRGRLAYTFEGVAFGDGSCIGVACMNLRDDEPIAGLPAGIIRYLEREYHGEVAVADECEIRLGRHPGRQVTYEAAVGSQQKSYSRWFLVGNRLYDVAWITGRRPPSVEAVGRFFESFRLLAEPHARVTLATQSPAPPATGG